MKIIFVGGGTLGPVTPLLAVARAMKRLEHKVQAIWIGTPDGPEKAVVQAAGLEYYALPVAKFPRHPSWQWLTLPFNWLSARVKANSLISRLRPDAVVAMGGFTAVPVFYAAARRCIPCFTHQLDLEPGLANRKIAKLCKSVTTSFDYEKAPFTDWVSDERVPTPSRYADVHHPGRIEALHEFGLHADKHTVLIFGGGTGAQALNDMVKRTKSKWLEFCQLIHVTGEGKGSGLKPTVGYAVRAMLNEEEMLKAYVAADVVVCRAGMGALSEIAALKKAAVIVPIAGSHQEVNADAFEEAGGVILADQKSKNFDDELMTEVRLLLNDASARQLMGRQASAFLPTDDGTAIAERILKTLKHE